MQDETKRIATHVLVFMVIGINSNIKMSIGHFPTRSSTADELFPLLWKAVAYLEITCGLKVQFLKRSRLNSLQMIYQISLKRILKFLYTVSHYHLNQLETILLMCEINWYIYIQVISSTSDKASPNQRLYRLHRTGNEDVVFFADNPFSEEKRNIYFFSDVPHLIKTIRNNVHKSRPGGTKYLWVSN